MGLGDGADDRKAEAEGAATVTGAADEALEEGGGELGRHAGAIVLDHQQRLGVVGSGGHADRGPRRGVAQRVLDQVEREAEELVVVALHDRRVGVDREVVLAGERPQLGGSVERDPSEVHGLVRDVARDVGAGEQQQVGDESAHTPRGAQGRARRVTLVAAERFGEQLEVGEHGGERRAQLVGGVGDEAALTGEHRFGLGVGVVERVQHPLQRAGELGDLVVSLGLGHRRGGVAGAGDLGGGGGERGDRLHRAAGDHRAGEQRETGAGERAEHEQQLDARDRALHVGEGAGVLDHHVAADRRGEGLEDRFHAVAVDVLVAFESHFAVGAGDEGAAEVGSVGGLGYHVFVDGGENLDGGVVGGGGFVEVGHVDGESLGVVAAHPDLQQPGEVDGVGGDFAVEVRADAVHGERADDQREGAEDHEREQRRDAGQAGADRQAVEGGRDPREQSDPS